MYTTVDSKFIEQLTVKINSLLKKNEGWKLYGNPFVSKEGMFYQAFTRNGLDHITELVDEKLGSLSGF